MSSGHQNHSFKQLPLFCVMLHNDQIKSVSSSDIWKNLNDVEDLNFLKCLRQGDSCVFHRNAYTLSQIICQKCFCLACAVDILTVLCFCSQQKILRSSPQMIVERV
jgi:hypothetical protein